MTGRGIDQIFAQSCPPRLHEPAVQSALDYLTLAEHAHGPISRPVDHAYVWGEALTQLAQAQPDVRIVNLETAITTREDHVPKGINYRMHPANVSVLTTARIDCCVLANNHVLDWGVAGLLETLETLERASIAMAGAGHDLDAARAPAILPLLDGRRVLVFGLGVVDSGIPDSWAAGPSRPGVHLAPDLSTGTADELGRIVRATKRPGDVAIASVHWGANWGYDISENHRRFARALIDRAAIDIVHGHSSHHPKAIEVHRGHLILYGCGDFLDDYEGISGFDEFRDDLVLMYLPTVDAGSGELIELEMKPWQIRNFRLNRTSAEDRTWLKRTLDRECRRFGQRIRLEGDTLALS